MTETLANGYSSESTQRDLSNEYQHDRVWMVFKNICVLVLRTKKASALEGLKKSLAPQSETLLQSLRMKQLAVRVFCTFKVHIYESYSIILNLKIMVSMFEVVGIYK